ncbi:hypothetical protein VTJ83DRAFT_6197 [Remersonia thermophila]|uniref:AAA+ ATPase domain-containing protein n=1 Tax=Remersonia thermophila TaxID=72144 RepID=A0ABR4D6B8_9PEZI
MPVDAAETLWRWWYKVRHLRDNGEKTLSDFSSTDSKKDRKTGTKISSKPLAPGVSSKNVELGGSVSVKELYEGPHSRPGNYLWVDYPPRQMSKSVAKAQDRVAIKVFKIKDREKPVISGRYSLCYHQVEIQNPQLVAAVAEILKKQDVHIDVRENAVFQHPFQDLYFGYDDMAAKHQDLLDKDPSNPLRPFLLLFLRLLDDIFAETRIKSSALRAEKLISYNLLWTLFPRDTTVVSWGDNCELLFKVTETLYVEQPPRAFLIKGKVLRFDGRAFLWEDYTVNIRPFAGNRPIAEMTAYPLAFHESPDDVRARLTARGRKVLDYQGLTYVNYNGVALHITGQGHERHNVEGRVLLDVIGYNKHHLAQGSRGGADPQAKKKQLVVADEDEEDEENLADSSSVSGSTYECSKPPAQTATTTTTTTTARVVKRLAPAAQERNKHAMLALEAEAPHLMYLLPTIEGYALKNKLWVVFYVEDISPMSWNDEAYDHLVYNEQQKDLVLSFVESHCSTRKKRPQVVEDVIAGKGEGLVILLSGPPGTGKTLMAEAVADRTRRPLFYLHAEDLGINAAVLGANIKKIFEMATDWDAVILLDEADVFMAERHPQDIARNELVSIFLRELEYFRGTIFLTTNLFSTIDSAFRSRVSLHLLFSALTDEARKLIWRKFLDRLPASPSAAAAQTQQGRPALPEEAPLEEAAAAEGGARDAAAAGTDDGGDGALTEEDIGELAAWQLNGREIKTAVKMARIWCDHKRYALTLSRLENAIRVTSPHASKSTAQQDMSLYDE